MALGAPQTLWAQSTPSPLEFAHAHNDYSHTRPLFDALEQGFCSVEADVFAVGGKLLVAHERSQTSAARTLESLYLKPLQERAQRHQGAIQPGCKEFTLLVDIKSPVAEAYPLLRQQLERYADMLTSYRGDQKTTGAVTVILTGNRPFRQLHGETLRLAALDGRLADLDSTHSAALVPLISDNWNSAFTWDGQGSLSPAERAKLEAIVARAHAQGRHVRFWAAPDQPNAWRTLRRAGVDLVNTDHLAELRQTLGPHSR